MLAVALLLAAGAGPQDRLAALLSTEEIGRFHRMLTRRPHPAGMPESRALAGEIAATLRGFGWRSEVRTYQAYLSYPKRLRLTTRRPDSVVSLEEPSDALEPQSAHPKLGPGFVAYSASGKVSGPAVYVHYGLPADYAELDKAGVSARGAIVIARYGRSHRAVKVHTAEQRGARGIVIYSDPADDGHGQGPEWPKGPWRAPFFLQRGNAKYSWFWHGDPLTPGAAATPGAKRLRPQDAPTLPKIPALVISWAAAKPILAAMQPPRRGPGPVHLEMDVAMDDGLHPIHNVLARLDGRQEPDRLVMLGTHHDAWTFGGVDPGSSAAVVLETARALAALCKSGWQPRRSIQIAFWDAEEYGLIGSTEHAEEFADQLRRDAVAYINTDFYLAGPLKAGGTPALRALVEQEAAAVAHPSGEGNLLRLWPSRELEPLGSGADFVPFQTFLGLPALSLEFAPHSTYGAYHSNYDTAAYMNTHGDPGWRYGRALAELLGRVVLRLASEEEPPLRSADTAARLSGWVRDLASRHPQVKRLEARLTAFSAAAQNAGGNRAVRAEKAFVVDTPDRRWFRHTLYGWNIYALYAGQTLPALHRALEARDTASAEAELARLETALDAATAAVADRWERVRLEMVRATIEARGVRDPRVLQAMRATLRHEFVPPEFEEHAYQDHPLPIGLNQTISQPYIVALMTELLEPKKDDRVLEIGTGSGYQAAVLSGLVKQVYTIELLPELATRARQTLRRLGYRNIEVRAGDGYLGWPEQAPFDKIIVTAAPETVPEELVKQLKPGGRLVVPVGTRGSQDLLLLTKNAAGRVTERRIIPVAFVPMVKGKK